MYTVHDLFGSMARLSSGELALDTPDCASIIVRRRRSLRASHVASLFSLVCSLYGLILYLSMPH